MLPILCQSSLPPDVQLWLLWSLLVLFLLMVGPLGWLLMRRFARRAAGLDERGLYDGSRTKVPDATDAWKESARRVHLPPRIEDDEDTWDEDGPEDEERN